MEQWKIESIHLEEIAGGFLLVTENGQCKQLCGVRFVLFLEVANIESNVVSYIGESPRVERSDFQVAQELGFYLSRYDTTFLRQIWAEMFCAKCWHQFRREPLLGQRCFKVNNLWTEFEVTLPLSGGVAGWQLHDFQSWKECSFEKAAWSEASHLLAQQVPEAERWYSSRSARA